ncbi:hypothetical protein [Segetibacter aerophilus]|uniref:Uncharacterized protein n=1 Tax=Segetibacter aerophilus TaxID=670293 RepID=A0A512B7R0_9BACT|nr:hypothetical protein [Segetibacter aerophilus]GEO08012.1 hypothetical protein SAE01_05080 [Segetibacter aerophilus]
METRNNADIDTTKVSPVDTKRFEVQDNNGHIRGSRQANSNEQDVEEQRGQEDNSEYNKLDDRGTLAGNEAS